MAAMMGSKTVSFSHRMRDANRGGFFSDRKMQHTARGLLPDEQFSNSFFERPDPPHPAVNLNALFLRGCHVVRSSILLTLVLVLDGLVF